jgi:uncharacterized protein (TIGR00730 family)
MNRQEWNKYDKSTDAWQILRIQGEFARGFDTFSELGPCVSVFGSARTKEDNKWYQEARKFGSLISQEGFGVITGGGPGIMEAANRGAHEAEGVSVGIGIELPFEASMNKYTGVGIECRYFFTRKVMFLKYSQAFICFPGGVGTQDELFEVLTLAQTGHTPKFPVVLVGKEYWTGLIDWIKDTLLEDKYISPEDMNLFKLVDTAEEARDHLMSFRDKYRQENQTNF